MTVTHRVRATVAAIAAIGLLALGACSSANETTPTTGTSSVAVTTTTDATGTTTAASERNTDGGTGTDLATTGADAPATGPASIVPAPTTDVPAPGGGDINQTVAAVSVTTESAVPLTASATAGAGVQISLGTVTRIDTVAEGPGEVSGPGLLVPVTVVNDSGAPLSLDGVNVTLADAAGNPAAPMTGSPAAPFSGELAAGGTLDAVYVFALPADYTEPATVGVGYSPGAPIVQFSGTVT